MIRKYIIYFILFCMSLVFLSSCSPANDNISDKLIRFHVIANSDSPEDQNLKLNVRNKVLEEIGPKLESSKSKEESERIINKNIGIIKQIAEKEIANNGMNYPVAVSLGKSVFPVKSYSNIVLPAGEYDALKITIGSGEGKNWWCVMFPPLCFIDITHGVTSEDTETRMKAVLNDDEYQNILSSGSADKKVEPVKKPVETDSKADSKPTSKGQEKIEMKFKSVEIIKSIIAKFQTMLAKNN